MLIYSNFNRSFSPLRPEKTVDSKVAPTPAPLSSGKFSRIIRATQEMSSTTLSAVGRRLCDPNFYKKFFICIVVILVILSPVMAAAAPVNSSNSAVNQSNAQSPAPQRLSTWEPLLPAQPAATTIREMHEQIQTQRHEQQMRTAIEDEMQAGRFPFKFIGEGPLEDTPENRKALSYLSPYIEDAEDKKSIIKRLKRLFDLPACKTCHDVYKIVALIQHPLLSEAIKGLEDAYQTVCAGITSQKEKVTKQEWEDARKILQSIRLQLLTDRTQLLTGQPFKMQNYRDSFLFKLFYNFYFHKNDVVKVFLNTLEENQALRSDLFPEKLVLNVYETIYHLSRFRKLANYVDLEFHRSGSLIEPEFKATEIKSDYNDLIAFTKDFLKEKKVFLS